MDLRPYIFCLSFYHLYFALPPFEHNGLHFWVPDVLCQHSEVVLWNFLSVQMFFWWICGGESSLPILFLFHLRTTSPPSLFWLLKSNIIKARSPKALAILKTCSSNLIKLTQDRVSYKACKIIPYFQVKIKWANSIPVYIGVTFCKFQNQRLTTNTTSVQLLSIVRLFVTPWTSACHASQSITNSWSLTKLMSTESVTPSNHLILCHPLLLLPSIFPSTRVFSNESALHIRWPKYWSFSFNISPSNEHQRLIVFRMVWLDLLALQGTLKSLLQLHSSKT